jgi:hypothetical protein
MVVRLIISGFSIAYWEVRSTFVSGCFFMGRAWYARILVLHEIVPSTGH